MLKRLELADPQSCLNKAHDDEMLFVLIGRDKAMPATIRYWVNERLRLGLNMLEDPQIQEALELLEVVNVLGGESTKAKLSVPKGVTSNQAMSELQMMNALGIVAIVKQRSKETGEPHGEMICPICSDGGFCIHAVE